MIFPDIAAFRQSGFVSKACIIGTGPAGITIARHLAAAGVSVTVLEAGADDISDESQDFYKGKVTGDPYFDLDITRLRYLGGSSNHWAGWCRLLDTFDFEERSWIPNSGWPIRRSDLKPYFDQTVDTLELGTLRRNIAISDDIDWIQLVKSPAVRFGEKYRAEFDAAPNIALVLNTTVLNLNGDGKRVSSAALWSNGSPAGEISADTFIVCTGGLENSRLLLWSNEVSNGGVVPQSKALGKYWMEHPQFEPADAILFDKSAIEFDETNEAFFSPSQSAMARLGIMNFGARLIQMPYHGIKEAVADLACVAPAASEWVASGLGAHLRCAAQIYLAFEQAPYETNHIALSSSEKDAAGVPRMVLNWKKGELERKTMVAGLCLFGETLARRDLGRLRFEEWVLNNQDYPTDQELAGHHHMGGTRMGTDPNISVVDANQKVHGMDNLYIGGSSVFATSGHANPTTTIVCMSHRLGDYLSTQLKA
jgi:choline dehydrogenase-like flavoprotein